MIRVFLKRAIIFLSIPIIISILLIVIYSFFHKLLMEEYKLDSNISEIYIGDSHIEGSINDNLIKNSKNFGQLSETYYFSYFKLKAILEANPQIKVVYLGYGYHSFSNYFEDYISGKYSKLVSPKYYFILPISEQFKLIKWNSKELPLYFKSIMLSGTKNLLSKKNYTFSGGYNNEFINVSASKESMDKRLNFQFYTEGKLNNFSVINLYYLRKIVDLCSIKNIELILFSSPLHLYYRSKLPIEYCNKYNDIIESNNLKIIDFSELKLGDEYFIPDGDHVSEKGALLVTKKINEFKKH